MKALLRDGALDGLVCDVAGHFGRIERSLPVEQTDRDWAIGVWLLTDDEVEQVSWLQPTRTGSSERSGDARVYRYFETRHIVRQGAGERKVAALAAGEPWPPPLRSADETPTTLF
jgi:hypothetical protein